MYSKVVNKPEISSDILLLLYHRNLMLDMLCKSFKLNRARTLVMIAAEHLTTLTGDSVKLYDLVRLIPERRGIAYRRVHILIEAGWLMVDKRRKLGATRGGKKAAIYISLSDKGVKLVGEFWRLYSGEVDRYSANYNYVINKIAADTAKGAYINVD